MASPLLPSRKFLKPIESNRFFLCFCFHDPISMQNFTLQWIQLQKWMQIIFSENRFWFHSVSWKRSHRLKLVECLPNQQKRKTTSSASVDHNKSFVGEKKEKFCHSLTRSEVHFLSFKHLGPNHSFPDQRVTKIAPFALFRRFGHHY